VTGYALALASVIPLTGWAGDRFGTRRLYLLALVLFTAGSALCAIAGSMLALIALRVVQGVGGGLLLPLGMTILTRAAGPERMGRLVAVLGVPVLLGPIAGPLLGGWLVSTVGWRWIFLVNLPIGALACVLAALSLPRDLPLRGEPLDLTGLLLLSPGLGLLLLGVSGLSDADGAAAATGLLCVVAGAALLVGFLAHVRRAPVPLLDPRRRCCVIRSGCTADGSSRPCFTSDRQGEFVEGNGEPQHDRFVDGEFVVAAADVLQECVPDNHHRGAGVVLIPRIGLSRRLSCP